MFGESHKEFLERKAKDLTEATHYAEKIWTELLSKSPSFRHQVIVELDKYDNNEE